MRGMRAGYLRNPRYWVSSTVVLGATGAYSAHLWGLDSSDWFLPFVIGIVALSYVYFLLPAQAWVKGWSRHGYANGDA